MINYLKDKYYWYNTHQKLKNFLSKRTETKILLYGYPKSGNTWLRFLIYNYKLLLINPSQKETISYERLNSLQNNVMDRGTIFNSENGFPLFYRTHKTYRKPYDLFDKKIFIHRNPLDTLISAFHFYQNREIPFSDDHYDIRDKLHDLDFYVLYKIDLWINYYKISIKHADIVMNYTELKNDTAKELNKLVQFLSWDLEEAIIKKSVEFSAFNNVKKMGEEQNQKYGNGPKDGSFKGEFTRSGEEAQFKCELKEETINFVLEKFPEFKNLYPNLVE
jgi:hypothetical protein